MKHEWVLHERRNTNGPQSFEKILKFLSNDQFELKPQ